MEKDKRFSIVGVIFFMFLIVAVLFNQNQNQNQNKGELSQYKKYDAEFFGVFDTITYVIGYSTSEEEFEEFTCPECGNKAVIPSGGCNICLQCGYSKCN